MQQRDPGEQKQDRSPSLGIAIDGTAIRRLRETKKLTQLYIASVVGVTTDTISRWENNRYPTIKRDNAEKLAEALEVQLEDLLLQEEPTGPAEMAEPAPVPAPTWRRPLPLVAALVLALLVGGYLFSRQEQPAVDALRLLPRYAAPGLVLPVQIKLVRNRSSLQGLIVREHLPPGWSILQSSPQATAGKGDRDVKWLIPAGNGPLTISYTLRVPSGAVLNSHVDFRGEVVATLEGHNQTVQLQGNTRLTVSPFHWADSNGDGSIDDQEIIPAYYQSDEMKELGLDWPTIEAIWSGKGYSWNTVSKTFELKR